MSYYSKQEEKEEARKWQKEENKVLAFNDDLKANPALLQSETYLFSNMDRIRLKLKDLPENHHHNILLMTQYFKFPREKSNYKIVPHEIRNNQLFLISVIKSNPEIYFYVSPENQKTFKSLCLAHDMECLKYFTDKDYDSTEVLKVVAENLSKLNKTLTCLTPDNFKKISNSAYARELEESIKKLDKKQCFLLQENLQNFIEEKSKKSGYWLGSILEANPYLYTILDKDKYQDEKRVILQTLRKYHDLFSYLPEEWKKDKDVIKTIITVPVEAGNGHNYNRNHPAVIKPHQVINQLEPEDLLGKNFVPENMQKLIDIYPDLNLKWRSNEIVINMLFKARDKFEITTTYCRAIPDKGLSESLVDMVKNSPDKKRSSLGDALERVMLHYKMDNKLDKKEDSVKKMKI